MAYKIIGMIQPFDKNQSLYVYNNGNKVEVQEVDLNNLSAAVFNLAEKYGIEELELIGPKMYNKGLGKVLQKEEMLKYKENKLKIIYK